jgi:tetratricopeptide (TPR) repeat protein
LLLFAACSSPEDPAGDASEAVRLAVAGRDWIAAQAAIEALQRSRPETPDSLAELGSLMVEAGEASQAVWLLENGVARFPSSDALRVALAVAALRVGEPGRALLAVEPIGPDSPIYSEALLARAEAQVALADGEQARATTLALEEWGQRAAPALKQRLELTRLGLAALEGEGEVGLAELSALVERDPEDVAAWVSLERELRREGRSEEACALLVAAVEQEPGRIGLYAPLAQAQLAKGDAAAAEAALRRRVELHPTPAAHLAIARLRAARGDADASLARYELALAAFPNSEMLRSGRAELLLDLGLVDDGRREVEWFRKVSRGSPRTEYLRARLELAQEKPDLALRRLAELVLQLDTPTTQLWLGHALEATEDLRAAEERYLLAARGSPHAAAPALAAARLARNRGDWRAVVGLARPAVAHAPHELEGWELLADALAQLGLWSEAEASAREAVSRFPQLIGPRVRLAEALRSQRRPDEALAVLDEAAGLADAAVSRRSRNQARRRSEKRGSSEFEDLVAEPPEISAERAMLLGVSGKAEEAMALCDEGLARAPKHARLQGVRAVLLLGLGRQREGVRGVDIAVDLDPSDLRPLRSRAEYYIAKREVESARRDCETYLLRRPDDPHVLFLLGMAHEAAERNDKAIEAYRQAAELDPESWASRNNLAMLLVLGGDLDGAVTVAEEARALAPTNVFVLDTLGFAYLRAGQAQRAVGPLEEALARSPDAFEIQLHLAEAYTAAGRSDEAGRILRQLRPRAAASPELTARIDQLLAD